MTDPSSYCREIERYLCRKNDGHLIRIVGPAFDHVRSWATQGVPLKVAFQGIDRYVERYYAKGPRRRPVRIEFCEADVLDAFEQWRRAVGVTASTEATARRPPGLERHLERAVERLRAWQSGRGGHDDLARHIDELIQELDRIRLEARGSRGDARRVILARLSQLEADLLETALASESAAAAELGNEARLQLDPFRSRLSTEDYEEAVAACVRRLARDQCGLPEIALD